MKRTIIILILFFAVSITKVNAQVTDTLAYLNTIVANKSQFIDKPFSVLMTNLQIQIKFFSPFAAITYDKRKETSTSFSFYFPQTAEKIYLTYPCLEIYWQPYLNSDQSHILYNNNNNGGGWNSAAAVFYSTGIIKDIQIRE